MKTILKMYIEDEESKASVERTFDPDDDMGVYEPEEIAACAQSLLAGFGYFHDKAMDIQSVGWTRPEREKPYFPNEQYLVSISEGKYMKTHIDEWDGEKFIKYGDKVVFWAGLPSSPGFWAYGG